MSLKNAAPTAKVVSLEPRNRRRTGQTAERGDYRVSLFRSGESGWSLKVEDRRSGRVVIDWKGGILRGLIDKHPVLASYSGRRSLDCSKDFIRRLVMTKAALELGEFFESGRETTRFSKPDLSDACLADLLRSRPGVHYTLDDVSCLMALEGYCASTEAIERVLGRLCDEGQLQRIDAAPGRLFYDCDPRPHLHIYDPARDELRDAPDSGVLSVKLV